MASEKRYEYVLPKGFVLRGGENDYVIEEVLGKGGFGVTYRVRTRVLYKNIKIDAFFAVKEFFPDICSREADNATIKIPETKQQEIVDGKKDFINEGLKLQEVCKLNPNIVNVNEVFEANGTAYYVLEYLEGGDLRKMIRDNGKPLTEKQMLEIMTPIGYALQCLHDNRMLHLDVKPDNVVMRVDHNDGTTEPVLIDFGISAHFNKDGTPTSKTPSQGISPGYSPIEQYAQVNNFDPRIDVYAFSATCFYLLTGKDPIVAMEMTPEYVKNSLSSGISSNVVEAIERGMAMNKNSRTGSINEVLSQLSQMKKTVADNPVPTPIKDAPDNNTRKIKEPAFAPQQSESKTSLASKASPAKAKSRKKWLAILGMALAVALVAGLLMLSKRCGGVEVYKSGSDSISDTTQISISKVAEKLEVDSAVIKEATPTDTSNNEQKSAEKSSETDDIIYKKAAQMPKFPGGEAALQEKLNEIIYASYDYWCTDMMVVVEFVVEKNGKVGDVKVVRSSFIKEGFSVEDYGRKKVKNGVIKGVVSACKKLPAFSPGRNEKGEPVRVWYTLNFHYVFDDDII